MGDLAHLAIFAVDDRQLALPLTAVERVVRAVEVTPLPAAPRAVIGVINVQGRVIPVISLRRRCGLPEREVELADQLVIARASRRTVALLVDRVEVVEEPVDALIAAAEVVAGVEGVSAVLKRADGLVLVYEPDTLLSIEDESALGAALNDHAGAFGPEAAAGGAA